MIPGSRGYEPCTCRDCFEIAIGKSFTPELALCWECRAAGCEPWDDDDAERAQQPRGHYECQVERQEEFDE